MATSLKTPRWTLLAKPRHGEHSLWQLCGDPTGSVYIADCSGRNPDRTDDGPLRLVGDLVLRKGWSGGVVTDARVIAEDSTPRGYTRLHQDVALYLVMHEGFRVVIGDDDLRVSQLLLSKAVS